MVQTDYGNSQNSSSGFKYPQVPPLKFSINGIVQSVQSPKGRNLTPNIVTKLTNIQEFPNSPSLEEESMQGELVPSEQVQPQELD